MTTATAVPCRSRWTTQATPDSGYSHHECGEPANHPGQCRCCRCGATTTRPTEGD